MPAPAKPETLKPRWNYGDRPGGTNLIVQRVQRHAGSFLYDAWCSATHTEKAYTEAQILAMQNPAQNG